MSHCVIDEEISSFLNRGFGDFLIADISVVYGIRSLPSLFRTSLLLKTTTFFKVGAPGSFFFVLEEVGEKEKDMNY